MSKQKLGLNISSDPVFISVPEASKRFGYTRGAIYNMTKAKKITFKNVKDGVYVSASDLEKRFEANKNRIKSNRKAKRVNKVVSKPQEVHVINTNYEGIEITVIVFAGVVGAVLGYLIATLTK
jgi:hypothetical protein